MSNELLESEGFTKLLMHEISKLYLRGSLILDIRNHKELVSVLLLGFDTTNTIIRS